MWPNFLLVAVCFTALLQYGESIMCHRCYSAMGGCGSDGVVWRMFPWRDCGTSDFCVKVVIKDGGETKIIRECETNLMKTTFHRLRMPVLRRHGYCLKARKNDFYNPLEMTDDDIEYCFCNDWNGCNSATSIFGKIMPFMATCATLAYAVKHLLL